MKRRAADGFTLLELLVALSLISVITATLLGGINIGRRAWEASKAGEAIDEVEGATRAIADQIAKSFPIAISTNDQAPPSAGFVGAPDGCRFVALSEGGGQWGGLILTEIAGENLKNSAELAIWTRVYRPNDALTPQRESMIRTTLVRDVAKFEVAYFGALDKDRYGWTDSWRNKPSYPKLVSVKLGANRMGRVVEATVVVALKQQ